jgi:hypothetical protein
VAGEAGHPAQDPRCSSGPYPLSAAADPPSTKFLDAGDTVFDSTILYGTQLFESVTRRGRGRQPSAFDGTWKPAEFRPAGSG